MESKQKKYEAPHILSYNEEEVASIIGPANTVTSGGPPGQEFP